MRAPLQPAGIVAEALRLTAANFGAYARLAAVPFLVCLASLLWAQFRGDDPAIRLVAIGLSVAAIIPVATAWHRFVILGAAADRGWLQLSFGGLERRYVWASIRIGLASLLVVLPLALVIAVTAQASGQMPAGLMALALLAAILAPAPFLLALPAAAAGDSDGLLSCWRLLRGDVLRLAAVHATLWLVSAMLDLPAMMMPATGPGAYVATIYATAAAFAWMPWWVAALSLAYRRLADSPGAKG